MAKKSAARGTHHTLTIRTASQKRAKARPGTRRPAPAPRTIHEVATSRTTTTTKGVGTGTVLAVGAVAAVGAVLLFSKSASAAQTPSGPPGLPGQGGQGGQGGASGLPGMPGAPGPVPAGGPSVGYSGPGQYRLTGPSGLKIRSAPVNGAILSGPGSQQSPAGAYWPNGSVFTVVADAGAGWLQVSSPVSGYTCISCAQAPGGPWMTKI